MIIHRAVLLTTGFIFFLSYTGMYVHIFLPLSARDVETPTTQGCQTALRFYACVRIGLVVPCIP